MPGPSARRAPDGKGLVTHPLLLLGQAQAQDPMGMLVMIGGVGVLAYFLIIRPEGKRQKEQTAMLAALKKGDEVVTQGGLLGKIFMIQDKVLTLEVASGVKLRVLKSAVTGKVTVNDAPAKDEAAPEAADKKEGK